MPHRRARRPHAGLDRITACLAAGALACLGVLGGCGPQHAVPLDAATRAAATSAPVPAARPLGTPVPAAHETAAPEAGATPTATKS